MTQVNRLDGGLIDRSTPLGFTFDGRRYGGFAGDTLASALVANGVRLVGRSFKYHRFGRIGRAERPCRASHRRPPRAEQPGHHN